MQNKMIIGSGGGGSPKFRILQEYYYYNTSNTLTLPSGTDFVVAISSALGTENSATGDLSSLDITAMVTSVGDSATSTQATKNGSTNSITCVLTWTSATQATLTRSTAGGCTRIYACAYV